MVLSYIMFAIVGLAAVGYYVWNRLFNPNPLTLNKMLFDNAEGTFKMLGALSTVVEVLNLALNDMQVNGTDPFQAFSRYILYGIVEVFTTFYFISVVSTNMKKAAEDGKITFVEYIKIVISSGPLFIFGILVTAQLHNFYLWSIYHIEYQQTQPWVWFLPFTGWHVETDPVNFQIFQEEWKQPIVPATVTLIYLTPVFNVFLVFAQWYKLTTDIKNGVYDVEEIEVDVEDEDDQKDEDKNKDEKDDKKFESNITGLKDYFDDLYTWFGINESDFRNWLSKYIGTDLTSGSKINNKQVTNPDVLSGKISSDEVLIDITEKLIGSSSANNNTGLAGIKNLTETISTSITKYKTLIRENAKRIEERDKKRTKGESVGDLNVMINEYKEDINELKDDILEELEYRKGVQKEFLEILRNLNFKVPNYIDSFEKKVKEEL